MKLADQYRAQYSWRSWSHAYEKLPIVPDQLVLDLGCAVGDQAADLADRQCRVMGFDANQDFISAAQERQIPNARFVQADLGSWADPSLLADGLWSSFTAAYFPDFAPVLKRWVSAIRTGAWVALTEVDHLFGHEPLSGSTQKKIDRFYEDALNCGRYDFLMGRKLRQYAEGAGLSVQQEISLPDHELAFSGAADPTVVDAWSQRLERMKGFQGFLGEDYDGIRSEFLDCLSATDHISTARVVLVVARKR
jgi:SAM-dependent methyltransferase